MKLPTEMELWQEAPETYPQLNLDACESEIMERLSELEADEDGAA